MKPSVSSCLDHTSMASTTPSFIKITALALLSLSLYFLFEHLSSESFSGGATQSDQQHKLRVSFYPDNITALTENPTTPPQASSPPPPPPPPPRPPGMVVERTGIIDKNGVMTEDFVVGEFDEALIESVAEVIEREEGGGAGVDWDGRESGERVRKIEKYEVCDESMRDYIPCMDNNVNGLEGLNSSARGKRFERHCPEKGGSLDCLVPRPKGYKKHVPWPKSRDEVWSDNIPLISLTEDNRGLNGIARKGKKFIFPVDEKQFPQGADNYLDQISKMVPEIAFGKRTRVALDVGGGVASFGTYLIKRDVITLSIAPKDVNDNQIQIALERGVPAMVIAFASRRLLYPSQAFDLIHCLRCKINWTRDDGILLLEANRILRAGGYFIWAAEPVYRHEVDLIQKWEEMEKLASSICWTLVKREEYIAVWQKPVKNTCYLGRIPELKPPLCDADDNPDHVWNVDLQACISRLPEDGSGANVATWPGRLHQPPDRLLSIEMDAITSRKEIYKARSRYWHDIANGYVNVFRWKKLNVRNVLDMNARYGGFGAAMHDYKVDCWVMNVVPVSGPNTLPVIYDRGLIGVLHDWCEPFDTYPRTYDLINAAALFSIEQKRCNMSTIMLEMDRILRPGGRAYIRDLSHAIDELKVIADAMGWVTSQYDTGEGPNSNLKLLNCEKRL